MKKINLRNFAVSTFLLLFVTSNLFSIDFPLKRDDLGPGSVGLSIGQRGVSSRVATIPVSISVEANELGVYFDYTVGGAYINVQDANGVTVLSTVVDTTNSLEFYFPVDELESGSYTFRVKYGSTRLIGVFTL